VGRSWLDLAHVVYFKYRFELVFDSVGPADPSVLSATMNDEDIRVYVTETELRGSIVREPITVNEIKIGPEITDKDRFRLVDLINTYRDVFAKIFLN
jgi:hypothetical protein